MGRLQAKRKYYNMNTFVISLLIFFLSTALCYQRVSGQNREPVDNQPNPAPMKVMLELSLEGGQNPQNRYENLYYYKTLDYVNLLSATDATRRNLSAYNVLENKRKYSSFYGFRVNLDIPDPGEKYLHIGLFIGYRRTRLQKVPLSSYVSQFGYPIFDISTYNPAAKVTLSDLANSIYRNIVIETKYLGGYFRSQYKWGSLMIYGRLSLGIGNAEWKNSSNYRENANDKGENFIFEVSTGIGYFLSARTYIFLEGFNSRGYILGSGNLLRGARFGVGFWVMDLE